MYQDQLSGERLQDRWSSGYGIHGYIKRAVLVIFIMYHIMFIRFCLSLA